MQLTGKIKKITITEDDTLSLRVSINDICTTEMIDEITKNKGISLKYTLVDIDTPGKRLFFTGKIQSINIIKGLTVIMHTAVIIPLILKALELKGKPVYVRFITENERELLNLLESAAKRESVDAMEILYRLTTFYSKKDEKTRPGKRSIFDVSASQRKVVMDKLHRSLSASPT